MTQGRGAPASMLRSVGLQLLCSGQCGIGRGDPISLALEEEEEEEEEEV